MVYITLALASGIIHHAIYDHLTKKYFYKNKLTMFLMFVVALINTSIIIYFMKGL